MSKITQVSTYDETNSAWNAPIDIGAKAENIEFNNEKNLEIVTNEILNDVAIVEESTIVSYAHEEGDYLIHDGVLYFAAEPIAVGDTLIPGVNIKQTNVGDELVPSKTAEGNPVNFYNKYAQDAASTKITLDPIQDLHGYDKPWVGGAGKNLLPMTVEGIKANNTDGTWSGNAYTYNSVTFTVLTDSDGNVTGIKAHGLPNGNASLRLFNDIKSAIDVGTNVIGSGCPSGGGLNRYVLAFNNIGFDSGSGINGAVPESVSAVNIICYDSYAINNLIFYPMIRLATESDDTFEPYTNICPILGRTQVKVEGSGKNLLDDSSGVLRPYTSDPTVLRWGYKPIKLFPGTYTIKYTKNDIYILYLVYTDTWESIDLSVNGTTITVNKEREIFVRSAFGSGNSEAGFLSYFSNVQLELGSTATEYEPYQSSNDLTISFGQTVYSGTVDVEKGELVVDRVSVDLGSLNWTTSPTNESGIVRMTTVNAISNMKPAVSNDDIAYVISDIYSATSPTLSFRLNEGITISTSSRIMIYDKRFNTSDKVADFESEITGHYAVYELATPTVIPLTPAQVHLLQRVNNISTDGDSVTLTYKNHQVVVTDEVDFNFIGLLSDWNKMSDDTKAKYSSCDFIDQTGTIYGFHIDGTDSDPFSIVTYLADALGKEPAHMDYANDTFDYGDWEDAFFMPKPCMLKSDGTVDYYLDPTDYSKKADGTASDISDSSYDGNAMMEWGQNGKKIWWKIVPDLDTKSGSVFIADYQADPDFHDYNFHDCNGNSADHFYTPIYNGSVISNKMRSLSGQQVSNKLTGTQERTAAQLNNPSTDALWDIETFVDRQLINFLLVLIGKSTDTQAVFGQGLSTNGSMAINNSFTTGVHNAKGLFYGTNSGIASTYTNAVKVFGMENWYGFQWRRLIGWIIDNKVQKLKLTYGTEDSSSVQGYNFTGDGYLSVGATLSGTSGQYIKQMSFSEKGMIPQTTQSSSVSYFCDGLWFNESTDRVPLVGGSSDIGALVGVFCSTLPNAASLIYWGLGAALSCKPLAS